MFYTSTHMEYIHDHADYGFTVSDPKFNWRYIHTCILPIHILPSHLILDMYASLMHTLCALFCSTIKKSRDDYVKRLNGIYFNNLKKVVDCFFSFFLLHCCSISLLRLPPHLSSPTFTSLSLPPSLTQSLTHSLTQSLSRSVTPSLTPSLLPSL